MTNQNLIEAYITMCPLIFLHHQVEFYSKRMAEVQSKRFPNIKEFIFLKKTLEGLKKNFPKHYN